MGWPGAVPVKKDLRPLLSVLFVLLLNTRAGSIPMAEAGAASATAGPVPIWIGPSADGGRADAGSCPLLRTSFRLAEKPRQATVRIVGLGHYELRLNGRRVGDGVLNQAWSAYDKTLFTQEFDVADLLKAGENVFGVRLGNSFWRIGASNDPGRYRGYATD
jgi:hypothetical protein